MSYNKTNWINGQTPINETNLNNIENGIVTSEENLENLDSEKINIDDNVLIYRGSIPSSNLNDIQTTGIYYIAGQSLTNAPSNSSYSILIVVATSLIHQYIIKPVGNAIYMREYSGSPGQWYSWQSK